MALLKASRCPNCLSERTKEGESGGWICLDCGHWFGEGHR